MGFWWGDLRESDHLEELGIVGKVILKWMLRKYDGERAWSGFLWPRTDRWRTRVNAVINLRVP